MKVTFCDYASPNLISGPTIWLERLLPELRKIGVESRVLFIRRTSGEALAITSLRRQGFECKDVLHIGNTKDRIRWILEDVIENRPDTFVANTVIPAYYAGRWIKQMGIPTLGILHSDSDYYQAIQDVFVYGAEEYRLSAVVPVSEKLEKDLLAAKIADVIIKRIPYGVPLPAQKASWSDDVLRLIYMGRLEEEQKQISETARSLCRIVREIPHTEAIIYGDGSARENVIQIIESAGDLPISYGGRIAPDRVMGVMSSAHVFVLLSDYEGLPVAMLEAMACGLVPVCLKIKSGIPELVQHEINGFLVTDRETAFQNAIRALKQSPDKWLELSAAAQKKVISEYSIASTARQWKELFESLPAKRTAGKIKMPAVNQLPVPHPALERLDRRESAHFLPSNYWVAEISFRITHKFLELLRRNWKESK